MSALKAWCILVLFLCSFLALGHSATVVAAGTKTVEACAFAVEPTLEIVRHLSFPTDWKIVVVCNDNMWELLMRQSKVQFVSNYAFTFQPNRVTFIRARIFLERMRYTPSQVLAHELGHIVCKCDDEERAWSVGRQALGI